MTRPGAATRPSSACDLDGVIWRGDEPIAPAAEGIAKLRAAGLRVGVRVEQLELAGRRRGRQARPHGRARRRPTTCVTSAMAAACAPRPVAPAPAPAVLVCAGPGVRRGARRRRAWTRSTTAPPTAVVVGFHRDFDYDDLDRASRAVRDGRALRRHQPGRHLPDPRRADPRRRLAGRRGRDRGREARPRWRASRRRRPSALIRERFGTTGVVVGDRPSTDGALADGARMAVRARALGGDRRGRAAGRRGDPRSAAAVRRPPTSATLAPPSRSPPSRVRHGSALRFDVESVRRPARPARLRSPASMVESAPPSRPSGHGSAPLRVSCAGDSAPATRRRARAPGVAREPPSGGRGDRGRTRPRRWEPRPGPGPAGGRGRADPADRRPAPLRLARRREAGRRARALRGRRARAPGPRRRRVHRRVHRLPAAGGRRARRTRSTSGAGSSRGRCATTRGSPCGSAPTSATLEPERPRRPGRPHRRRPVLHLAAHGRARARPLHHGRRRSRPAGEAAVRGGPGAAWARAGSCATPTCTGRCSARCVTACATPGLVVVDVMASPLRGADGNVEFLVRVRRARPGARRRHALDAASAVAHA